MVLPDHLLLRVRVLLHGHHAGTQVFQQHLLVLLAVAFDERLSRLHSLNAHDVALASKGVNKEDVQEATQLVHREHGALSALLEHVEEGLHDRRHGRTLSGVLDGLHFQTLLFHLVQNVGNTSRE